jgi:hypothetical protein
MDFIHYCKDSLIHQDIYFITIHEVYYFYDYLLPFKIYSTTKSYYLRIFKYSIIISPVISSNLPSLIFLNIFLYKFKFSNIYKLK